MIPTIITKILSESLLSLYPIFVKKINISLGLQLWSRFFTYVCISFFFIDWLFIYNTILSIDGLLLSFVTLLHVFFSYRGFQLLESGISYVMFYTYPIMILLLSGENMHYIDFLYLFVIIIGIFLLFFSHFPEKEKNEKEKPEKEKSKVENKPICGFIMILFAAFTEACIYFIVRRMKTNNNWNHLFISYFFGAIFLTGYYLFVTPSLDMQKSIQSNISIPIFISVIINFVIGLFGYLLRFYSITRLPTKIYALLSYVGIVMAYIYGVLFNQEKININKIVGSICIIIPVYWLSIANR